MNVNAVLYKPMGLAVSIAGGLAANAVFRKVWEKSTGDKEAPEATDPQHGWLSVLIGAAVQGAIFGLVKAAVDRGGAVGYQKLTGHWPDDDAEDTKK